jgi:hypothetical protein
VSGTGKRHVVVIDQHVEKRAVARIDWPIDDPSINHLMDILLPFASGAYVLYGSCCWIDLPMAMRTRPGHGDRPSIGQSGIQALLASKPTGQFMAL